MALKIANPKEIALPEWLGATGLTLAEIGAVCVFACAENGHKGSMARMGGDPEMKAAVTALLQMNVLTAANMGEKVLIGIDLDEAPVSPWI